MNTGNPLDGPQIGSQGIVGPEEGTLREEMQLKIGQERRKGVRVVSFRSLSGLVEQAKAVTGMGRRLGQDGFEQSRLVHA